jgi:Family of unknown function (DUF5906)
MIDQVTGNSNHQPQVSQRARRNNWFRWYKNWQFSELLPIIPPGASLGPMSKINPKMLGKVPGTRDDASLWNGLTGSWAKELHTTRANCEAWDKMGAGIGMQGRIFPGLDIDVEDEKLSIELTALAVETIGDAPIRIRDESNRRLLMYRIADGETPLRKRRVKFKIGETEHAVELLGWGQYYNVEGPHPKGGFYSWRNGHPCERGPSGVPEITKAKADAFFAGLVDLLDIDGYPIVADKGASNSTTRTGLENPRLWAPKGPEQVLELLKEYQPEHLDHDDYVAHIAAIKAALGPHREDYRGEVLEWSPGVRSGEPDQFEARWNSITNSALGFEWLTATARGAGYRGDAQHDFADTPQADGTPADPNAGIPETDFDQMLKDTIYVSDQNLYYSRKDGQLHGTQAFRAKHSKLTPYGSSGQKAAEAQFQNADDACKVSTLTVKPGAPVLTKIIKDGRQLSAVNLWRPSLVKPNLKATVADVAPWLDLVEKLFGAEGVGEREHFLDWCAYNLQKPGQKIGHALVLVGGQGVGKDTVLRPFFEAVGLHNVATIDSDTLAGQWEFYLKAPVIYVQEATKHQTDFYNKLKPYISAQRTLLPVNEKHMRQWFVENFQNWLVTTNFDDALRLEEGDRRFWVHRVLIEEPPPEDYFDHLHSWFDRDGTRAVFGWLLQRDIASFKPKATPPMTAAKQGMLDASQAAPVRWLREQLRVGGSLDQRHVVTIRELRALPRNDFTAPVQEISDKQVMTALKAEGFKGAHRVHFGSAVDRLWARGVDGTMSAAAMKAQYLKETERETSCKAA